MPPITPGTKLGAYEVIDAIGAGGMGTVYRARDTRLPREAAVKVSAEKFSDRFAREAHAIASLNHPNITTLYDVGPDYLVMELVEGPTLAERIAQGPLSLDEAATIGRQIADALDYAHERGIVHRDLKPGNVKIRPDGLVKVLDFGLAKAGPGAGPGSDAAPTISAHQTAAGVVVGTFAYMSPEQLTGKPVDKRTDVWAFGCVFYEMLTGKTLHRGDSSQEVMASVLRDEPDLSRVPAQARRLLKRCLEKDPQKRLRHIGDVMALLDEPPSGESSGVASALPLARDQAGNPWLRPVLILGALLAAAVAVGIWAPWRSPANVGQAVRFEVPESDTMKFFFGAAMAVSPDGRWMVFPARDDKGVSRYWLRSLDTVEARPLSGTEGAYVPAAWTADSRSVLFTTVGNPTIKKIDIQGGPPQTISTMVGNLNGASTNRDGVILFASNFAGPLFRVSPDAGAPVAVTTVAHEDVAHRFPQFLPDGRHFLYFRQSSIPDRQGVYVGTLDERPEAQSQKRVLATNREAYYAGSPGSGGHLLFLRDTTLMAQPFDTGRMELGGEAVPLAENVDSFPGVSYGMFSVSDSSSGALAYRGGAGQGLFPMLADASGRPGESFNLSNSAHPALSPDGTRLAVGAGPSGTRDIWTIDLARRTTARLTFDPADDDNPVWSPDSKYIAFSSTRGGGAPKPYVKPADGSADERLLTKQAGIPTSWSHDGRFLLFTSGMGAADIWVLPNPGQPAVQSKPHAWFTTPFNETDAQFSPDGRWIAYTSNESGEGPEVYVRPFSADATAANGAKWLVSAGGFATYPHWTSASRLLFAKATSFDIQAVDVDTSKGFQASVPRRVFDAFPPLLVVNWTVSPDEKRFAFVTTPNQGRTAPFTVVLNWEAALKK